MSCYDPPGSRCSGHEQPGTRVLADAITHRFPPGTTTGAYGIYNCRANTANPSQISLHGEGRAIDVGYPQVSSGHPAAHAACAWLISHSAGLGVQFLVYNRRKWGCEYGWANYGGPNPHTDHIHVEQRWAHALDADRVRAYLKSLDVPEDDMPYTPAELKLIVLAAVADWAQSADGQAALRKAADTAVRSVWDDNVGEPSGAWLTRWRVKRLADKAGITGP